jgi:ATP/maltotriose-dependent transcriptional regulator MalT
MRQGDLERSRRVIDEMEQITVARGDERSRVMVLWVSGMLDWFAGRLLAALEIATEARVLAHQTQLPHGLIWVGRLKALVEADLGHIEQARASAREGLAFAESAGNEFFTIVSLGSLGRAELALGNAEQAAHFLRDLPARLLAGGINDPTVPAWADAIEALVRRAEIGLACDYLERYETHAQRLSNAWALSGAARCRGLVNAARGDLEGGIAAAQDALTVLRGFEYPLERGRANLVLGSLHRQAQHKGAARTNLGEAIRLFEGIGARPWAELARAQLRRISGRRPSPSDLTESEHVVARFAAQGLSNKEIAVASHMAISTVEAHLSRVYRKLGVGRAGLAGRLLEPVEQVKPMVDPAQT